jgi:hypothetical protein
VGFKLTLENDICDKRGALGPLIGFFGMAFTTYINMQMLGHGLRLDCHGTDDKQWEEVARHLGTLRRAVKKLEKLYKGETAQTTVQVQVGMKGATFFPAYSCFDSTSKGERKVWYLTQLFEGKLVFYGKCGSDEVLIKFVKRYLLEVHEPMRRSS